MGFELPNPFQKKFLPFLITILIGVVCSAINHDFSALFACAFIGVVMTVGIDQPMHVIVYYMFILASAALVSLAVWTACRGFWAAAGLHLLFSLFPLSILYVRDIQR